MENVYKKIVDTVPVFFFLWSQRKKATIFISERFYDHRSQDNQVAESSRYDLRQYVHPESQLDYDRFFSQLSQENGFHDEIELRASCHIPGIRWMKLSTFPVDDDGGAVESIAGHITDISQTKEHYEFLEDQVESLDTVAFMLTHDLTSPITNMMGLAEVLKSEVVQTGNTENIHLYDSIYNFGEEVITTIHGLVNLLELSAKKEKLILSKFSLTTLLQQVTKNFHFKFHSETVIFSGNDMQEDTYAYLHPENFEKAIEELMMYLLKYTTADSTVSLTLSPFTSPDRINLGVTVSGVRLPTASIRRVLNCSSALSVKDVQGRALRGMLGLVIAKEIVELHQGTLRLVEGEPSGFAVDLPVCASAESTSIADQRPVNLAG